MSGQDTPREQDARFNQAERDYIATLRRRIDWLAHRVAGGQSAAMTDWIKRELAALNWVLRVLMEVPLVETANLDRLREPDGNI
jgi:hypothetical protein